MHAKCLATAIFVTCSACGSPSPSTSPTQLWIFAGQSNCVGAGHSSDLPIAERAPDDRVQFWYANNETTPYPEHSGGWESLVWQHHDSVPNATGGHFGPELSFGETMADRGEDIAIVKWAVGSTSLADRWMVDLYPMMLDGVRRALDTYGDDLELKGLVWVQGESDATTEASASAYADNLAEFVSWIRSDLRTPGLRVIVPRTHTPMTTLPYLSIVREQQAAFVAADANAVLIDTDAFTLLDQGPVGSQGDVHYDSASQQRLGEMIAAVVP